MEVKIHNTAGCYLVRQTKGVWEIILIYKKWAEDNQGWAPPKGHVEEGETLEQAAIRETTEETGYKNMKILQPLETLHLSISNPSCDQDCFFESCFKLTSQFNIRS